MGERVDGAEEVVEEGDVGRVDALRWEDCIVEGVHFSGWDGWWVDGNFKLELKKLGGEGAGFGCKVRRVIVSNLRAKQYRYEDDLRCSSESNSTTGDHERRVFNSALSTRTR